MDLNWILCLSSTVNIMLGPQMYLVIIPIAFVLQKNLVVLVDFQL